MSGELSHWDRAVIASAYEVDAKKCRAYPTRDPFSKIILHIIAGYLESRAKEIWKEPRV